MVKTVDARKKLVVDVTGKHIAKGSRHDSRNCALELAIE